MKKIRCLQAASVITAAALALALGVPVGGGVLLLASSPAHAQAKQDGAQKPGKPFSSGISGKSFSSGTSAGKVESRFVPVDFNAIKSALNYALSAANCDKEAVEAAISQTLQSAIARYGDDATAAITSAVMREAERGIVTAGKGSSSGLSAAATSVGTCGSCEEVGAGLARAAVAESATNPKVAAIIAKTIADEGKPCEIVAFQTTSNGLGHSELAALVGLPPAPTPETKAVAVEEQPAPFETRHTVVTIIGGGSWPMDFVPGGGGGSCLNPSCTSL